MGSVDASGKRAKTPKCLSGSPRRLSNARKGGSYQRCMIILHFQAHKLMVQIYAHRSTSEARRYQELPPSPTETPQVGAVFSPPIQETPINIPEIAPMRRGRPNRPDTSQHNSARPSPSPFRGASSDPFATLDGGKPRDEEFASKFPSLDQFNILHETKGKFDFEPTAADQKEDDALAQKLTNALADEAFAKHSPRPQEPVSEPPTRRSQPQLKEISPVEPSHYRDEPSRQTPLYQPSPQKPTMVSTGTMTSPPESPRPSDLKPSNRPIYKFPAPESQPTADSEKRKSRPGISHTTSSQLEVNPRVSSDRQSNLSASSRPSMEALRPSELEVDDSIQRSRSANSKSRPVSIHAGTKLEIPPRSADSARSSLDLPRSPYDGGPPLQHARTEVEQDRSNISSDVDYLRAKEEESTRKREKRYSGNSSKHAKRSSLSTLSLSGTKIFAGRFGDAFRRFEGSQEGKTQSPAQEEFPRPLLSPASGSESTAEPIGNSGEDEEEDSISPEMRRELERRRLSQEEKRVASAAADYRRRVAEQGEGGRQQPNDSNRPPAILNRVQNLLGEAGKAPPLKTASGYGRFTETPDSALQAKQPEVQPRPSARGAGPPPPFSKQETSPVTYAAAQRTGQRPTAPPKPQSLRAGTTGADASGPSNPEQLQSQPTQGTPASPGEDWETNFSRRFPSLSGLEMVETEIEAPKFPAVRTKEV